MKLVAFTPNKSVVNCRSGKGRKEMFGNRKKAKINVFYSPIL